MSFIDNIDLGSRYDDNQSRLSSRRGTVHTKSRRATVLSSRTRPGLRSGNVSMNAPLTPLKKIAQSLRKPDGPEAMSDNDSVERTVQEIKDFEHFEFLELRSSFYSYVHVMTLGIASFTRGYYMCIYNVMGLVWLLDVYKKPE
jgi:MFS family permease